MKYCVEYSKMAIRDLERVWNDVFEASKDYDITQKYMDDLMNKVEVKTDHPKSGIPLYYDDLFTGYYYVIFKAYLAFYRIESDKILVDRVLLAASDYVRHLHIRTDDAD